MAARISASCCRNRLALCWHTRTLGRAAASSTAKRRCSSGSETLSMRFPTGGKHGCYRRVPYGSGGLTVLSARKPFLPLDPEALKMIPQAQGVTPQILGQPTEPFCLGTKLGDLVHGIVNLIVHESELDAEKPDLQPIRSVLRTGYATAPSAVAKTARCGSAGCVTGRSYLNNICRPSLEVDPVSGPPEAFADPGILHRPCPKTGAPSPEPACCLTWVMSHAHLAVIGPDTPSGLGKEWLNRLHRSHARRHGACIAEALLFQRRGGVCRRSGIRA